MLAVVLAILAKTVVNLKLGLGSISKKNNKSHIFKHLHSTAIRLDSYNSLCLKIIDKANSKFDLKIKIVLHINWRKPNLNPQRTDLALTFFTVVSVPLFCSFLSLFVLFYRFSLFLLLSLSLTLIICIFYFLCYTSLLLHLISTHLVSHLSLSSIVFIFYTLIIEIFYCLSYTSLFFISL